jgi:hypothetical protein
VTSLPSLSAAGTRPVTALVSISLLGGSDAMERTVEKAARLQRSCSCPGLNLLQEHLIASAGGCGEERNGKPEVEPGRRRTGWGRVEGSTMFRLAGGKYISIVVVFLSVDSLGGLCLIRIDHSNYETSSVVLFQSLLNISSV